MTPEIEQRIAVFKSREIPAGYKQTKMGVFPNDWTVCKVSDVLQKVETPVQVEPDTMYTQIGIRSHGKGLFYKEPVTGASLGNKSVFWIQPDCFVLNIVFAWEQAIGKTTENERGMIGSHRFPMYRSIDNRVDIDYLICYFLTKRGTDVLDAASPGGAGRNRTLGQDRFMKSAIILPPIEQQRKIAAILSTQDCVIDLKQRRIAEKQQQKKYLMQMLLTGKKRLPGYAGGWKQIPFESVFEFGSTNTYSRAYMLESSTGVKNIHYGDILIRYGEVLNATLSSIPSLTSEVSIDGKTLIADGDIVIADTAEDTTAGKVIEVQGVGSDKIVAGLHTMLCHPVTDDFAPGWLGYYMNSTHYHNQLIPYIAGVKVMSITKANIVKTTILVPSKEEQTAIVKILSTADKEITLLQQDLEQENQKKKALMQLLLTGIVRV